MVIAAAAALFAILHTYSLQLQFSEFMGKLWQVLIKFHYLASRLESTPGCIGHFMVAVCLQIQGDNTA